MFKVDCPGCNKPYQVDERRVPAKGLRMRCGQCGTSFEVGAPKEGPAEASLTPGSGMPAVRPGLGEPKRTSLGLSGPKLKPLGAAGGLGPLRVAAAASAPPRPVSRRRKPPVPGAIGLGPSSPDVPDIEFDLGDPAPEAPSSDDLPSVLDVGRASAPSPVAAKPEATAESEAASRGPASPSWTSSDLPGLRGSARGERPAAATYDAASDLAGLPAVFSTDLPELASTKRAEQGAEQGEDGDLPGLPALSESELQLGGGEEADLPGLSLSQYTDLPDAVDAIDFDLPELGVPTAESDTASGEADDNSLGLDDLSLPALAEDALPALVEDALPALAEDALPALADSALPELSHSALPELSHSGLPALQDDEFALPSLAETDLLLPTALELAGFGGESSDDLSLDGGEFGAVDLPQIAVDRLSAIPGPSAGAAAPSGGQLEAPSEPPAFELPDLGQDFSAGPVVSARQQSGGAFGDELDFQGGSVLDDAEGGELSGDGFGGPPSGASRGASDPSAYGEVDLGDDGHDSNPSEGFSVGDGMEFGEIPQEAERKARASLNPPGGPLDTEPTAVRGGAAAASAQVSRSAPKGRPKKDSKSRRPLLIGAACVLLVGLAGGALAVMPRVGPFGYFYLSDLVNASGHEALLVQSRTEFVQARSADGYAASERAVERVSHLQQQAPRYYPLLGYLALTQCESVLRFGGHASYQSAAVVAMDEMSKGEIDGMRTPFAEARACLLAVSGELGQARDGLKAQLAQGSTVEGEALLGEVNLKLGDYAGAQSAWASAVARHKSPWTLFGLARSLFGLEKTGEAEALTQEVLQLNPEHVSARLLLAELKWLRGQEAEALAAAEALQKEAKLSPEEKALAFSVGAEIHFARGRLSRAETGFAEALKLAPKDARALLGLADTLLSGGRYAAALARYEAARTLEGATLRADLGIARSQMELEQLPAARSLLAALLKKHPDNVKVRYVDGLAAAAGGDRTTAEAQLRFAGEQGAGSDEAVLALVALARLKSEMGEQAEATAILEEAEKGLPDSALLHRTFGEVALAQGRYEKALRAFSKARELLPTDVRSFFQTAVCLRKLRRFDEAFKVLDQVAALDAELPGLPLERGLVYEESGRGAEALAQYEEALKLAPEDLDLLLRVGCGRASAGDGVGAEVVLKPVALKRTNSAELNFCLGRALALQGQTLVALKRLQRATELDAHQAEYFLHLGWLANEAGQVAIADAALDTALELDKGLADAYWQRGVSRLRRGAASDAIGDLKRALALKPERYEARAELAQAYYSIGKENLALIEWHKAVSRDDTNPLWLFRYGKLLQARHRNREAANYLTRAIKLVESEKAPTPWLWEAHHLAAATLGNSSAAAEHWRMFLELGPSDSPYRRDAIQALAVTGKPWTGP